MAKKRSKANGEGSIYKRKSDNRWVGSVTIGTDPTTGKIKRKTIYGNSKKEVDDKLSKIKSELLLGTFAEPTKITVEEWLNTWLEEYKQPNLRPTTYRSYESLIKNHLVPILGNKKLSSLKPTHIQKFYNSKVQEGKSAGTIKKIHAVLHEALEQAIKNNLIIRNMSKATQLPRSEKQEVRVFTVKEQQNFIEKLEDERLKMAFIFDLSTGLRVGELLALSWSDIDMENTTVTINKTVVRINNKDMQEGKKTKLIIQPYPKTRSGSRKVPIPKNVIKLLNEHKIAQKKEKIKAGELYKDNTLVFNTVVGTLIDPRNFTRTYDRIAGKAKIQNTSPHVMRHTYATRLLENNIHPKTVQELLGHSSITVTLDTYSHVLPEIKHAAAAAINNLFKEKKPSKMKA